MTWSGNEPFGDDDGFTLIEVLIVVMILAVLAAIVTFAVGMLGDRGTVAACRTNARIVETAEAAYEAKYNAFTTMDVLVAQKYLREAPTSPQYTIAVDTAARTVTGTLTATGDLCWS